MAPIRRMRRRATVPHGVVVPFPNPGVRGYNEQHMRPAPVPSLRPSGPFRLGEWTVRPERNLLETSGDSHHLEPKVMDALLLLADRDGEVVTKNDLIDGVWEGRIISEGTLTNTIAELRSALGDDARHPTYIETIPKRGYRLICPVEEISADVSDAEETGGTRRRWMAVGIVMVVCVVCVAVVAMVMRSRTRSLDPKVVLVAPFDNRTGDATLDPLSILARDRIVSQLSGSGIARPVVAGADVASTSLDELCVLARSKGAGLAMTGALYLHEGDVEVQAQIVDVTEGEFLYAVPAVTGSTAHAAGALDEVIQRGLGALATHLHAHAHSNLLSRPPVFAAYREFLAGSELFGRDMPAAIRHLRTATEIDPDFTSAAIRLAMALRATRRGEEGRAIMDGLEERRAELTEFERLWVDSFIADFEGRYADSLDALYSIERLVPSDWTVVYLIAVRELKLNRPRRAIAAFDELHTHSAELPDMVKRTTQFIGSYERLAGAWHIIGDHDSEL